MRRALVCLFFVACRPPTDAPPNEPDSGCLDDAACPGGTVCEDGACVDMCDPSACESGRCATRTSCATPFSASPPPPPAPECTSTVDCHEAGASCCSQMCVKTASADKSCGACGVMCSAAQFCASGGCRPLTLASLCTNAAFVVVTDGDSSDDAAAATASQALRSGCGQAATVTTVPQTDAATIDQKTGLPLIGPGRTAVFVGGSFFQHGLAYLEKNAATHVVGVQQGTAYTLRERATGRVLVQTDDTLISEHHDYFVVEMAKETQKSTLAAIVWGVRAPGTLAGGYYFATMLLPSRATLTKGFYVYEWTDTNNDGLANAGDAFSLITSG